MRDLNTIDVAFYRNLLLDATREAITRQHASQTLIQRRVRVGFLTAAKLITLLEDIGIIGPATGDASGARDVLVAPHELDEALAWVEALPYGKGAAS